MPEKPQTSARRDAHADDVDDAPEPGTDPAIRVVREKMRSELNWQGAKLSVAMAVVAVATAFGAYRVVLNDAAAQTDAGLKVMESRTSTLEQQRKSDRDENDSRFKRLEAGQLRTDQKLDALLDRLNVQNPAPTPKDGGQ